MQPNEDNLINKSMVLSRWATIEEFNMKSRVEKNQVKFMMKLTPPLCVLPHLVIQLILVASRFLMLSD